MSIPAIFYKNVFDSGTITSSVTTESGFLLSNLVDWRTYTLWTALLGTTTDQLITVDAGTAQTADSFAILGHDLFSQNATISIEYSSDNFAFDINMAVPAFVPTSNKLIYKEFVAKSGRYWRLKISTGYTIAPFLGILLVGERLQFERSISGSYDNIGETALSISEKSTTGNFLGTSISYVKKELSANFVVSNSWFTINFIPAWETHISAHKPFLWVYDPTDVSFVKIKENFKISSPFVIPTVKNLSLSMEGMAGS